MGWQGPSPDQFAARHGVKHCLGAISEALLGLLSPWLQDAETTPPYRDLWEASLRAFPCFSTEVIQAGPRQTVPYTDVGWWRGSLAQMAHSSPALFSSPICRAYDAPTQQHREQHDTVVDSSRETQWHHS